MSAASDAAEAAARMGRVSAEVLPRDTCVTTEDDYVLV